MQTKMVHFHKYFPHVYACVFCLPHCNYAHRLSLVLLSTLKHCTAVVTDFKCVQIENNVPLALLQMHYIR